MVFPEENNMQKIKTEVCQFCVLVAFIFLFVSILYWFSFVEWKKVALQNVGSKKNKYRYTGRKYKWVETNPDGSIKGSKCWCA